MFEPLPTLIRLERERQKLTQDALAKLAKISRSRLASLEKGDDNISLKLLLKVANTLGMRELRVGGLRIQAATPELAVLVFAAEAITTARKVVQQATASGDDLERTAEPVFALLDRYLQPIPDMGIEQAIERMFSGTADARTTGQALRELAETPGVVSRPPRRTAAKKVARKRAG